MEIQTASIQYEPENESESLSSVIGRRSQSQLSWDSLIVSALEVAAEVDPYETDLPVGSIVRAVDAVDWKVGRRNCDIRPRLLDKSSGKSRLVDSGSQISVTMKGPNDIIDNNLKLVAVNGSKIEPYGIKNMVVKMGRKTYEIPAVVCDIQQDILGMDFVKKFKLNFEWDDFGELYIVDRKAQIREPLQVVTVPTDTLRVNYLASGSPSSSSVPEVKASVRSAVDNEAIAFQVACMKELDRVEKKEKKSLCFMIRRLKAEALPIELRLLGKPQLKLS